MFPGQGAQKSGMLADLPTAQRKLVRELTGVELTDTKYEDSIETQLAVVILQIYQVDQLKKAGYFPTVVAGHSLGIFAAAYALEVITKEDIIKLVFMRAGLMKEAYSPKDYGMGVITGLSSFEVAELVKQVNSFSNPVNASDQNAPTQTVISGKKTAVTEVLKLASDIGASKAKLLNVPVLSHTPLLNPVANKLACYIENFSFRQPQGLYLANYNGRLLRTSSQIKYDLAHNLAYPVYWDKMLDVGLELDLKIAVEFSPGKVLTKLLAQKNRQLKSISLEQYGLSDGIYLFDKWDNN